MADEYEGFSRKDLIKMLEEANDNMEHYEKQCELKDEEYEKMVEEKNEEISELEEEVSELKSEINVDLNPTIEGMEEAMDKIALRLGLIDDGDNFSHIDNILEKIDEVLNGK